MKYTIPCLFGLEALVADELRRLDLKNVRAENGRVHCDGGPADIPRLNINLRCGARVLVELTLTPELAKMRLACMESFMASVSRNAVESLRTRWVSGSLSMSSFPS